MKFIAKAFLPFCLFVVTLHASGERLNVLFIVSEDNGPEIGCYGAPVQTPNFDKLAREGTLFRNAYVAQAGCSQSRAAFLTGLYPHQNGQIGLATWKYAMFSEKIPNVVKTLGKAGYRTGNIGKLHVNPEKAFPFDFKAIPSANFSRKGMAGYAENASKFIQSSKRPFYLQVNYPDAHRPFIKSVDGLPAKPLTGRDVDSIPFMGINHPELRQQSADYYNCMMRLDSYLGDLLGVLAKSGKAKNTVVVYIGDHGADVMRGKRTSYEGGVRIPMIIRWPGGKSGQDRKELVSTLDLFPTFCEIAGVKSPRSLVGRSLKPIVEGKSPKWRDYLFTEYHLHSNHNPWPQRTVRDDRYKLIYNPLAGEVNPGYAFTMGKKFFNAPEDELLAIASKEVREAYQLMKKPPRYELYDLRTDPYEFRNLADDPDHARTRDRLIGKLENWQEETGDALRDPAVARRLFDLIVKAGTGKRKALDYSFMSKETK